MKPSARSGLMPFLPALALIFGGLVASPAAQAGEGDQAPPRTLTFCATPDAMPRTGKGPDGTPRGLDVALARLLGRRLGRPIEFHWCGSADCAWNCVRERRCDVVLGQPLGSGPRDVAWSVPYAGGQFGLVVPRDARGVRSLADLRGKRVGIVTGTVALAAKDYAAVVRLPSREAALDRFRAESLDAALVDGDFAAWHLNDHPALALRLVEGFVPRERWDMALAVRAGDGPLLVDLNRALAELAESGALARAYQDLGVPFRAPLAVRERSQAPADTWRRVRDRGELVVTLDPDNLPYSSRRDARPGVDLELARALAGRLHVKLRVDWLDVIHETAMGRLLEGECDLVMGAAVDVNAVADEEELKGKVLYTRPYYGTGYVLVRRKGGPQVRTLAELGGSRSQRLGTEAGSVADYRLRRRGFLRRLFRDQAATLKGLRDGEIDFAYLWANVGWALHESPELPLELVPDFVPEDHWNIAVALRRGDEDLKRQVDEALGGLIADGTLSRLLARYHVPAFAPFPDSGHDVRAEAEAPIRHAVADRGREPQMGRIQGSKDPYVGLKRIRAAGELVVGLDQNNLPFSTAHPEPAGLDVEIARLLAEQIGVPLRVYWAYSSHDSYPSKLATKRLCDVILGVMPDDRFAGRVLYSRPYYLATYQLVVRSGDGPPAAGEPLAAEAGVAVRGLAGRAVHPYPSTEAILEAVATGGERAGYVVATRAPWLAHERWPGRLAFLPAPEPADRFPMVAAVRKTDRDLKDAIDRAWEELDRSGKLARAFDRWHIPYHAATASEPGQGPRP